MGKDLLEISHPKIDSSPFWEKHPSVLIYGAGNVGKDVFRVLIERGIPVMGLLDRKAKVGEYWNGVPILQPDGGNISLQDRKNSCVIIAIHNRDVEIPPIIQKLKALGFNHIITLIELYDFLGKDLGNRFWLTSRFFYRPLETYIRAAFSLWADETSKALYAAIMKFRLTGDYSLLPAPDVEHQYLPTDLPRWAMPLRFVDCGAYNGDTLMNLLREGIQFESVVAFEPDEDNFVRLAHCVRSNVSLKDILLWPCGVSSATKQLRFSSGQGEASKLSLQGNTLVQLVSLDDAIPRFAPTLIKMDIEGAEYEALLGAQKIIMEYKPGLAVSIYHKPEDLWQLPLLLEQLYTGIYKYYLRSHGFNTFDLVLYAVPCELGVGEKR